MLAHLDVVDEAADAAQPGLVGVPRMSTEVAYGT